MPGHFNLSLTYRLLDRCGCVESVAYGDGVSFNPCLRRNGRPLTLENINVVDLQSLKRVLDGLENMLRRPLERRD